MNRHDKPLAGIALAAAAALTLTACGGSNAVPTATSTEASDETPALWGFDEDGATKLIIGDGTVTIYESLENQCENGSLVMDTEPHAKGYLMNNGGDIKWDENYYTGIGDDLVIADNQKMAEITNYDFVLTTMADEEIAAKMATC